MAFWSKYMAQPQKVWGWGKGPIKTQYVGTVLPCTFPLLCLGKFLVAKKPMMDLQVPILQLEGWKIWIFAAGWADLSKREVRVLSFKKKRGGYIKWQSCSPNWNQMLHVEKYLPRFYQRMSCCFWAFMWEHVPYVEHFKEVARNETGRSF